MYGTHLILAQMSCLSRRLIDLGGEDRLLARNHTFLGRSTLKEVLSCRQVVSYESMTYPRGSLRNSHNSGVT